MDQISAEDVEQTGAPELPSGRIPVRVLPDRAEPTGMGSILATATPTMGSMDVMVLMAMPQGQNIWMLFMADMVVIAILSMVALNIYRQVSEHHAEVNGLRRECLAYLSEVCQTVRAVASRQRCYINWRSPDLSALAPVAAEGTRLWEREVDFEQLLSVRLGSSTQDLSVRSVGSELSLLADPDVVCHSAMSRFLATHSTIDDMPLGVIFGGFSHAETCGVHKQTSAQLRAMIAHLAIFIPPDTLRTAVLTVPDRLSEWERVKWLPHAGSLALYDALGPARMVTTDSMELEDLVGGEISTRPAFRFRDEASSWPYLLLIRDGRTPAASSRLGSTEGGIRVILATLSDAWGPMISRLTLCLIIHPVGIGNEPGVMEVILMDHSPIMGVADSMGILQAGAIVRRVTYCLEEERSEVKSPAGRSDPKCQQDLMELPDTGNIRDFDSQRQWLRRGDRERLRAPFGVTPEGILVFIEIRGTTQQGMGFHGFLIGATGSGKSEVLRTIVLAMALTHSSEQFDFVLIGSKGGATSMGMSKLSHVSAMISNLESELFFIDRVQDALRDEMVRRQGASRQAGNYANASDYEADRLAGKHQGGSLPALFIIPGEFSELLATKPEFIGLFVTAGRLGRSMLIHLLFVSQRLESGCLRGLGSHLPYRVGLRTFSTSGSREVLGITSAYELSAFPGVSYPKPGTDQMICFRASYVATPPPACRLPPSRGGAVGRQTQAIKVLPFTMAPMFQREENPTDDPRGGVMVLPGDEQREDTTELDIAVTRMASTGIRAHQVWLLPLDVPGTVDSLMPDLGVDPRLGYASKEWCTKGRLRVLAGIVDLPLGQRRELLELGFSGANGHMTVVGGPLSGKPTALHSIVVALSLTHTPQEVQLYILDFGGGAFMPLERVVHVAAVVACDREEMINHMFSELESIIVDREKYLRENRIDSIEAYRRGWAQGRLDDGYGDMFIVVDGWGTLKFDFEGMDLRVQEMPARALTFGVHLVASTARWVDLCQRVRDLIDSRLELHLRGASDSQTDRKTRTSIPEGRPGHGLGAEAHHVLVALLRTDGVHVSVDLSDGVSVAIERIRSVASVGSRPELRLLSSKVTVDELLALPVKDPSLSTAKPLVLGVEESRLGPLVSNPCSQPHPYPSGDSKSRKTNFLWNITQEAMWMNLPKEAQLFLVDLRRTPLGEVPEDFLAGYMTTKNEADQQLRDLAGYPGTRLPGDQMTTDQLRSRSWWIGAEAWVLADDYDLVVTASGNPLTASQPLMAQAQGTGLHVIVAHRMGGTSRAVFEPVLQPMGELDATGILLSGSPDEGTVLGRVKPAKSIAGHAQVVSRDTGLLRTQLVWTEPST